MEGTPKELEHKEEGFKIKDFPMPKRPEVESKHPLEENKFWKNQQECLAYLDELMKQGRLVQWLRSDIADGHTEDEIAQKINDTKNSGQLDQEEVGKIFEMLGIKQKTP